MTAKTHRSPCPLARTLDLVGDRWTLLVLRDLLAGKSTFKAFAQSPERIATNILTERLDRLMDSALIERTVSPEHAGRYVYRMTEKGRSMIPVLEAIAAWGLEHIEGTEARISIQT